MQKKYLEAGEIVSTHGVQGEVLISISRIISRDMRKITNAPATANDSIST